MWWVCECHDDNYDSYAMKSITYIAQLVRRSLASLSRAVFKFYGIED